jgi:glycosyltransferase involved in cell wall biosynthesis
LEKYSIPGPYFIYTGNAYPHKNPKRLIAATRALNTGKSQKVYLAIVSSRNVFVKRLEEEIKEEGAQSLVKILGFVPDNDLFSLYANSLAFTYPSLSEGFGLPGLEAILSGTLCLASNIAIFKEIYKDNAIYFNPFDYSSIERAMRDVILMGEGERERIVKKGQQFIKKYSWDTMAEATLKIYESSFSLRQGQ